MNNNGDVVVCPICAAQEIMAVDACLVYCPGCEHWFQKNLEVTCSYDAQYANNYNKLDCGGMSYARAGLILGTLDLPKNAKILDVGYGNGSFLKTMDKLGYDTYGIDVHGQDFGIKEVDFSYDGTFDLVCFFDSLEHFSDLSIPMTLKTNYIIVSMPNIPPLFPKNARSWRHFKPGEHLHYFTKNSLDRYFGKWGGVRIAQGHPEDVVRGRIDIDNWRFPNIYTAIYKVSSRVTTKS